MAGQRIRAIVEGCVPTKNRKTKIGLPDGLLSAAQGYNEKALIASSGAINQVAAFAWRDAVRSFYDDQTPQLYVRTGRMYTAFLGLNRRGQYVGVDIKKQYSSGRTRVYCSFRLPLGPDYYGQNDVGLPEYSEGDKKVWYMTAIKGYHGSAFVQKIIPSPVRLFMAEMNKAMSNEGVFAKQLRKNSKKAKGGKLNG